MTVGWSFPWHRYFSCGRKSWFCWLLLALEMLVLDKGLFVVGMKLRKKEILDKANLLFEDFVGKRFKGWGRLVAVGRDHGTVLAEEWSALVWHKLGEVWFPMYLAFGFWNVLRILPWSRCNGTDNDESPNSLSRPNSLKPKKSSPISSAKSPPTNISLPSLNILDPSPPVSVRAGRCWQIRKKILP